MCEVRYSGAGGAFLPPGLVVPGYKAAEGKAVVPVALAGDLSHSSHSWYIPGPDPPGPGTAFTPQASPTGPRHGTHLL